MTTATRTFPPPPLRLDAVAGVSVAELAATHGTPLFVYDAARIATRVEQLRGFDVIRYAQKACNTLGVVSLIRRLGCLVDTVSAGEIRRALAAGYQSSEIVYTADVFDRPALALVAETGVHVNCGSTDMVDQYADLRRAHPSLDPTITLRLNPGFGHGHSHKVNTGGSNSKHGIWHEELPEALRRAEAGGLRVTGLHLHIGSGVDMAHLASVCDAIARLAHGVPHLETISSGGGLPIPYRPDEPELDVSAHVGTWLACRDRLAEQLGRPLTLEVEPGRWLVGESGWLIAEVRAVKRQGETRYLLCDAGFTELIRPAMYGAYHPISLCAEGERPILPTVVGGPLCESGDVFTQSAGGIVDPRDLPDAKVGEYLIIGCAGAYASSMGSHYNARPTVPEVLVEDGAVRLIRRREALEDLTRLENLISD